MAPYLLISILFLILNPPWSSAGPSTAKVTSVEGRYMELNVGADKGIKVGDTGRIYYTIKIEGRERPIYTAKFRITHISVKSCMAQIEDKTGEIKVGYLAEILSVEAPPKTGELEVKSVPTGAAVYVDGGSVGMTPYGGKNLSPGSHKIRIERDGYEVWEKQAVVEIGKKKEILAELVLLKEGELEVRSEPPGAKIHLDGKESGETPLVLSRVASGRHRIQVMKEGFIPHDSPVEVKIKEKTRVEVTLKKAVGALFVETDPAGATIYVDGTRVGMSPYEDRAMMPGSHKIRVEKEGYEAWEKETIVKVAEQIRMSAKLKRIMGGLLVKTNPAGADVFIDGKYLGASPYEARELSPGSHRIRVVKEGYEDWEGEAAVVAGKGIEVPVQLKIKTGKLVVRSDPAKAKAFLNGKDIGETPLEVSEILPGSYSLRVFKDGYAAYEGTLKIVGGKSETVNIPLAKSIGNLVIRTDPEGGNVYVNEKPVGGAPYEGKNLSPGSYKVRVEKEGYLPWEGQVVVWAGKTTETHAKLELNAGELEIRSDPIGVKIYLDGRGMGETPLILSGISSGRHHIKLIRDGYDIHEENVEVKHRERTRVTATLKKVVGGLLVKTDPTGGNIYVDGSLVGTTPYESRVVVPGAHKVRILKEGHEVWEKEVIVKANERTEVSLKLIRESGEMLVQSDPPGAHVQIDGGKSLGLTPYEVKGLSPGAHHVRIHKEGYEIWEQEVKVEAGRKAQVRRQLVKLPPSRPMEQPSVIVPSQGEKFKEKYEAPVWHVDDSWRYISQTGKSWEVKVVRIESDLFIVKNTLEDNLLAIDKETLEIRFFLTPKGKRFKNYLIGEFHYKFPLEQNKKWSKTITSSLSESPFTISANFLNEYRVIAIEEVTVPAGKFNTFKIELQQKFVSYFAERTHGKPAESKKAFIWYSPEIKKEVKVLFEGQEWGNTKSFELVSYRLKKS